MEATCILQERSAENFDWNGRILFIFLWRISFTVDLFGTYALVIEKSSSIFFAAYQTSTIFNKRVDAALDNIQTYDSNKNTPVGQRITWAVNSWEVIMQNPILGIGTGDFPSEYTKINKLNTPQVVSTRNPHNMYILVSTQLGLLGLLSLLSIFYFQFKIALSSRNILTRNVGFTLPAMFLVIMLSDSYLLGHFTTLMYIFFSSFLYKDFENS